MYALVHSLEQVLRVGAKAKWESLFIDIHLNGP